MDLCNQRKKRNKKLALSSFDGIDQWDPPHLSYFSRKYRNLSALSTSKFTKEIEKLRIFFVFILPTMINMNVLSYLQKRSPKLRWRWRKKRKRNGTFERWNIQHSLLFHLIRRSHGDRKTGFWQASSDMYVNACLIVWIFRMELHRETQRIFTSFYVISSCPFKDLITSCVCVVWQWRILLWGQNVNERDVNNRQSIFFGLFEFFILSVCCRRFQLAFFVILCGIYFFAKVRWFFLSFSHFFSVVCLKNKQVDYFDVRRSVFEHSKMCVCFVMPFTTFVHITPSWDKHKHTHAYAQSTNESSDQPTNAPIIRFLGMKSSGFKCKSVCDLWISLQVTLFSILRTCSSNYRL